MNAVKRSVTSTMAKAMVLIVLLSVATTSFAIITLASSLNDAEAVNVAGSMRMQSYRLAHDIQSESVDYSSHIFLFERSMYSPSMRALQNWNVPDDITHDYYRLILRWYELKTVLESHDRDSYLILVAGFVQQIDGFVLKLQKFSEQKLLKLAWVGGAGLGGILLISIFVVYYTRREVVKPLRALVLASEQIKLRSFDVSLNIQTDNEMGILTQAFNSMAADIGKMYRGLEQAVNEKTYRLQNANNSLGVLYQSSQELTASRISPDNFQAILAHIVSLEGITAAKLQIDEAEEKSLILTEGDMCGESEVVSELKLDGVKLGYLYLEYGLPCPDQALIDNFVQILSRAVYYNHAQRQAEQLLLMEERATIARELHDSLAQSLSYLKIQVTLLKRTLKKLPEGPDLDKTQSVFTELDTGLSSAYTQLRELLTTFRLTIKEGTFGQALHEMISQLGQQADIAIELNSELSSLDLDAHQQIHLLQLIREATLNAIKHAKAETIKIDCNEHDDWVTVTVKDDGVGFDHPDNKVHHYGMSIMEERAMRLNGTLTVNSSVDAGCEVILKYKRIKEV